MKNAHLKKRVMTALISATTVAGTIAVVAPEATAATVADSYLTVNAYEKMSEKELHEYFEAVKKSKNERNGSIGLLPTEYGNGWCIDWGLSNPWDNTKAGYEVRKLTGASGRYGNGEYIDEDVRYAAINVVTKLMEDYQKHKEGEDRTHAIKVKTTVLRALLGNDLTSLNNVRGAIYDGRPDTSDPGDKNPVTVDGAQFRALTGFSLVHVTVDTKSGKPNYALVPDRKILDGFKSKYPKNAYVTIIVPRNYNYTMTRRLNLTFQRIIPNEQPGLNPNKKEWDGNVTITSYTTPPETTVTTTETLPPSTVTETIPQNPVKTTTTRTLPATTITSTRTLPPVTKNEKTTVPGSTVVTRTTIPGSEVTTTVTPPPLTNNVTTTVNGTPKTTTTVVTPEPYVTTETKPGKPSTITETVTEVTETITREPSTVTETTWTTPVKTTEKNVPGTTVTTTKVVTPAPVSVTETVTHVENYYREKVYESVKEVREYYHFAGFIKGEKSKDIEVPKELGGSWTFEVTKGKDIVIVERTEEGKLKITPKPGFTGEGDVEILITDDQGNQHIYRIKVSDTINVETKTKIKVNNFFYTINPGSENRVREVPWDKNEKYEWYLVDKDGNRIEPKKGSIEVVEDENKLKVDVKDPSIRGNVVVRITEEGGNVRENIVTVENTNSQFDVTRQILNTSTAIIERRGGSYTIKSGENLVQIVESEDGKNWVIKPKDGAEGTVEIVFTDDKGVEYNYTLEIVKDPNGGPFMRDDSIENNGSAEINLKDGWTWEIVDGKDVARIFETNDGKTLVVDPTNEDGTPVNEKGGNVVIHIKDKNGVLSAVWTVRIAPARNLGQVSEEERERDVVDRSIVRVLRGFIGNNQTPGNKLKIVEGKDLLAEKSKIEENDDFELYFKPGADGRVVVKEEQPFVTDGKVEYKTITKYIYNVKPAQIREMTYNITADNFLNLGGNKLFIVEGKDLIAGDAEDGKDTLKLDLKADAEGKVVIENRTDDGYVYERYTINVTPGRNANVETIKRRMTVNGTAQVNFNEVKDYPDTFEVIKGKNLVDVQERDKKLIITSPKGETGTAVIEVKDKRGVWARYELELTDAPVKDREYTVSTNSEFIATMVHQENSFKILEGAEFFQAPRDSNGQWILKPKSNAAGKSGLVVELDKNGKEINRYRLKITQGKSAATYQQRDYVIEGKERQFEALKPENTFVVVSGGEHADTKTENGKFIITPKKGTVGETIRVEERNSNGDIVRNLILGVVKEGAVTENGAPAGSNKNLPDVTIDNSTKNGDVVVHLYFKDPVKDVGVVGESNGTKLVPTDKGADLIIPKDLAEKARKCLADQKAKGKPLNPAECGLPSGFFRYTEQGAQSHDIQEFNFEFLLNKETGNQTTKGSSELDGKCIAGIVGMTAPLLLAIPLGILSQVQIPGLEQVSAQVNAAIRQANDQIQRGLGIHDDDRARRAAGIQGAFAIENPQMIGLAAGALGAITLGLLAVDGVMRACGAGEYTSSYMVGKATGNETLMKGSSDKMPESKDKGTEENKPAEDK
ncbi:hypothetical protein [uncultured Corynebacterium sp.]|uniref:hypothetical protein n=1 Tax=uncultured Corynebacterium sp. TaxID=159447 RepID=UPI002592E69E|nr:hypothetical protein [uncultured Corynebacterium sp.]